MDDIDTKFNQHSEITITMSELVAVIIAATAAREWVAPPHLIMEDLMIKLITIMGDKAYFAGSAITNAMAALTVIEEEELKKAESN